MKKIKKQSYLHLSEQIERPLKQIRLVRRSEHKIISLSLCQISAKRMNNQK